MPGNEDISKLPKWVQSRIEVAENSARYWKDKALEAAGEGENSNVVVEPYGDIVKKTPPRGLPKDSVVRFKLPKGTWIDVGHSEGGDFLEVRSGGHFVVIPWSGNSIHVYADKREAFKD